MDAGSEASEDCIQKHGYSNSKLKVLDNRVKVLWNIKEGAGEMREKR